MDEQGNSNGENDNASGNVTPLQVESVASNDEELTYIERFKSRQHLMPHWRNVLASPRNDVKMNDGNGLLQLLTFFRPLDGRLALGDIQALHADDDRIGPRSLADALDAWNPDRHPDRNPDRIPVFKAVLVSDLGTDLINSLGPTLRLSPEVFEEHLVKSGYTAESYGDADSSTWPTRFLRKQQVSLRWHSLVLRENMEPRDADTRRLLLNDDLDWKTSFPIGGAGNRVEWRRRYLSTLTNIFRQEWSLSSVYRPMRKQLVQSLEQRGLINIGEGDELQAPDELERLPENEMDVVAWEERVTFCWGSRDDQERVPILFFDPLPRLKMTNMITSGPDTLSTELLPFRKRLAPRGPPPAHAQPFGQHDPAALEAVSEYVTKTQDALSDTVAWLAYYMTEQPAENETTSVDVLLLAVLQVVRHDTEVLLEHIGGVLDQINRGAGNERMMQEQLEHWRTVLSQLQSELPALERSMGEFFHFPYNDAKPKQPPQLTAVLGKLQNDTAAITQRCQDVQQSLRAEMSLLESKRGIEEAESVSRLTELAFIFIPMTFAAGLFSMQIRELADEPAPAYAFVIAAIIAVAVSYGLRLVQRSTAVSELLHRWETDIRRDEQVTTRKIPNRKTAHWLFVQLRVRVLIIFLACGSTALLLGPLWTRQSMDVSLKGAVTGLGLFAILGVSLMTWVDVWPPSGGIILKNRGNKVLGFGRIWRPPPTRYVDRNSDRPPTDTVDMGGAESGGQHGPDAENQV
ncbi:hypothetical protein B0H66DRAFT_376982 [Apodospora peruviana]|uniref:Uncharacterized protein n=1 Tax=Apodospora peruviana TaxID=516989 RepID=A0AAE0HYT8_9PEZI|nr:hypothetical protein B0H66DRAFT_376982 [Apodospora peruviana]